MTDLLLYFLAWCGLCALLHLFEESVRRTLSVALLYAQILIEKAQRAARRQPVTQPTTPMESR